MWELRFGIANFTLFDANARAKILADQDNYYRQIDENINIFSSRTRSPEEAALLQAWNENYSSYLKERPRWFELTIAGKLQEAAKWREEKTNFHAAKSVDILRQLIRLQKAQGDYLQSEVHHVELWNQILLGVITGSSLLIGIIVTLQISRRISYSATTLADAARKLSFGDTSEPIASLDDDELGRTAQSFRQVVDYLQEVADVSTALSSGDLTRNVVPKGENDRFGFAVSLMIVNIQDIICRIKASAVYLSSAASKSNDTTQRAFESIEAISHNIRLIASNVDKVNESSLGASDLALQGRTEVEQTIRSMEEINRVMSEIMVLIERLAVNSSRIGNIVELINDIAKQTNLLALNATIEAARAGEQGRGFAVVADEVRQLAKHSTEEASHISELIQGIQREMTEVSTATRQGDMTIREGIHRANRAGDALAAIVDAVAQVKLLLDDISQSIGEQSRSTSHIVSTIEEVSVGANNLREKAGDILDAVAYFKSTPDHPSETSILPADEESGITIW